MGKTKRLRSKPKLPAREIKPPNRPSKFRQWSDVSMKDAMKAVHDGKMSINRAAVEHGVPPTTLKDRLYIVNSLMGTTKMRLGNMNTPVVCTPLTYHQVMISPLLPQPKLRLQPLLLPQVGTRPQTQPIPAPYHLCPPPQRSPA